jgi:TfoX/Sxy family transcriptional regulator of competence genes
VAYDEELAERIRDAISFREAITEREMFGGITFMLNGNMACGVIGDELIVRLGAEEAERALGEDAVRPFDFTGRPMRNWVVVERTRLESDGDLAEWVDAGASFAASLPPK